MKTRIRIPIVLAAAAVLLAASLSFWPAVPGALHAGRFVNAAPNALTPGQNAAIQTTNLLLQGESGFYQTYLPDIQR
jgi:hypothetical protein